ncbi:hypothetical protein [Salinisphaera sp. Q1T1-3]|uniref:hypothetical protein n=1 Tax=Salinisphaera sp. Q1T1-3 TaxID=2321229 RepID=UPI000E77035D|nr:hypothetical protein [Salinisphaera sp. Q1T1-3]RJS93616.1 hypothetical protein D3260_08035 [Salinisphaera sp. Q1T1-3]
MRTDSAESTTREYFVDIKSFPINVDLAQVDIAARYPVTARLRQDDGDPVDADFTVEFALRRLASFVYNPRQVLEGTIDMRAIDGLHCDYITLRFLPLGCLAVSFAHRLVAPTDRRNVASLRDRGHACYRHNLSFNGLIYDLVAGLSANGIIAHCPSLPYDILDPEAFWQHAPTREQFSTEMAWRAWSSGNFVAIGDRPTGDWPQDAGYAGQTALASPNGRFVMLFNNYFGWHLKQTNQTGALADDAARIADETEPVMYMISRRSQCASGMRNIQELSRAFVWDREQGLRIGEMRRYVSATRLAMLAPREYEESTDKSSRAIYQTVCRDLAIDARVAEFSESINMLAEDVRGLQSERDESESRTLNRIAFCLTCVFGLSAVNDIAHFIAFEDTLLSPWSRLGLLSLAFVGLCGFLWWLIGGARYRRLKRRLRDRA